MIRKVAVYNLTHPLTRSCIRIYHPRAGESVRTCSAHCTAACRASCARCASFAWRDIAGPQGDASWVNTGDPTCPRTGTSLVVVAKALATREAVVVAASPPAAAARTAAPATDVEAAAGPAPAPATVAAPAAAVTTSAAIQQKPCRSFLPMGAACAAAKTSVTSTACPMWHPSPLFYRLRCIDRTSDTRSIG